MRAGGRVSPSERGEAILDQQQPKQETEQVKPRKPGTFPPGVSGNPSGKGKPGKQKRGKKPKQSQLEKDMLAVYGQDEEKDHTPAQRQCRAWLKESPATFMARLHQMETGQKRGKEETPEKDGGEEDGMVDELIDRLLKEFDG